MAHPGWCENLVAAGGLKQDERVLVVVDEPLLEEGSQLAAAVKDAGGEPRLELWGGKRPLAAAPPGVLEGGRAADLSFFISQAPRGDEADARFQLMEAVTGHGGRQIFMGLVDGELLRGELSGPPPDLARGGRAGARATRGEQDDSHPRAAREPTSPCASPGAPGRPTPASSSPARRPTTRAARSSWHRTPTAPTASSSPT